MLLKVLNWIKWGVRTILQSNLEIVMLDNILSDPESAVEVITQPMK